MTTTMTTTTTTTLIQYTLWLDVDKSKFFHSNYAVLEGEIRNIHMKTTMIKQHHHHHHQPQDDNDDDDDEIHHPPTSPSPPPLDLQCGERCYVSIKRNTREMYKCLVPSELEQQRKALGKSTDTPNATGWLRHECYGLLVKVQLSPLQVKVASSEITTTSSTNNKTKTNSMNDTYPCMMPSASSVRNKQGTKTLDFDQNTFLGIVTNDDDCDVMDKNDEDNNNNNNRIDNEQSQSQRLLLRYTADQDDILTINQCDLGQRKTRHVHFAKWLIEKFGLETLNSGCGILDIAGGNGKLSIELSKLGIKSTTIIDPNPIVSLAALQKHATGSKSSSGDDNERSIIRIIPEPLMGDGRQFTDTVETVAPNGTTSGNKEEDTLDNTTTTTVTTGTKRLQENLAPFIVPPSDYSTILQNCSIIVGLHPDAATEPIVQTALRLHKPFAISPCCVMSKLFPNRRRQRSGEPVRTMWDLTRYILDLSPTTGPVVAATTTANNDNTDDVSETAKDRNMSSSSRLSSSGFQVDLLPFAGRNKVIYWKAANDYCDRSPLDSMYCQPIIEDATSIDNSNNNNNNNDVTPTHDETSSISRKRDSLTTRTTAEKQQQQHVFGHNSAVQENEEQNQREKKARMA